MSKRSISIVRTPRSNVSNQLLNIHKTKSQQQQQFESDEKIIRENAQWYQLKCLYRINPLPMYIPTLKKSQPYRLVIDKLQNISFPKKSASSLQYVQIFTTFITVQAQLIGRTCNYQCQYPIGSDGKFQYPICLYYHSKIDRSYPNVNLLLRFNLLQIKDGYVQSSILLGMGVIKSPFTEDQIKNAPVYKQCSEMQLITGIIDKKTTGTMTYSYSIESSLQIKNIIKFIPSETIISPQDHISGIFQQFIPAQKNVSIEDGDLAFINLKDCQIHIPDKFQEQVSLTLKNLNHGGLSVSNSNNSRFESISQRRIIFGFHNQYQLVMPIVRNLDSIGKQSTGQYMIQIYQALGSNQIVKIPYFLQQKAYQNYCAITLSLVYVYGQNQYEVAFFAFTPNLSGSIQQISQNMITGYGEGCLGNLLPLKCNKNPTLILEYISQNDIRNEREYLSPDNNTKLSIKSPRNIKQSQKILQQLQRQRLTLEKQRQQIQYLKSQKHLHNQQQYEKKLNDQKEQLRKNQQKLYQHYREQAQRQFNARLELENQIRVMKQRLIALEQGQRIDGPSNKVSYDQSPYELDQSILNQFTNQNMPHIKQKINPNYLIQQQKTIPINQVRQIMAKTFQLNRDMLQKELKQFNVASKFTITFNSIIWGSDINPPKSFYMTIKFFNFKQFTTDVITYIESGYHYHQLVRLNHYTYNLQNTTPTQQFTVDPSQYANPQIIQQDLINFLSKNNVIVDIFDAQNYLYIGQINIRMNQLFRGNKSQVMIAKEYNMVRLKGQENYGVMQILIKNQMTDCKDMIQMKEKRPMKQVKKKIVSNNPILISKQIHSNEKAVQHIGSKNQIKNRQQKRIQMFKKRAIEGKTNKNFNELQNNQKGQFIQKINQYKQKKMPELIKKIYEDLLTQRITINPYFGQTKTFVYQFTNMSQRPSSFRVSFQGNKQQLTLIKDPLQWKYFVNQCQYPAPKIYDMINDQDSFYLSAGETIPLVFKYLSFNKTNHAEKQLMTVTVTKQENNWIAGGFSLNIQPHQSVINHSYVLYQPGHQTIDIIIPVVFSSNDVRVPKRLFLTIQEASAQWINQYEIMLKVKTSELMRKVKFNMLLYEDDYFCYLRQNWQVELYSYEGVYAVSKSDEKTKFKISIPDYIIMEMKPNRIQFFSSHFGLAFEDEYIEGIRLAGGSVEVWCQLFPGTMTSGSIQVTCISEKKQLLYGWIIQVYPYSAKIN